MHSPKNCDTMRYRPRCLQVCKCELQIPFANAKGNPVENGFKKYSLSPSCWEESFFLESLYERRSCNSSRDSSLHWAESAGTKGNGTHWHGRISYATVRHLLGMSPEKQLCTSHCNENTYTPQVPTTRMQTRTPTSHHGVSFSPSLSSLVLALAVGCSEIYGIQEVRILDLDRSGSFLHKMWHKLTMPVEKKQPRRRRRSIVFRMCSWVQLSFATGGRAHHSKSNQFLDLSPRSVWFRIVSIYWKNLRVCNPPWAFECRSAFFSCMVLLCCMMYLLKSGAIIGLFFS